MLLVNKMSMERYKTVAKLNATILKRRCGKKKLKPSSITKGAAMRRIIVAVFLSVVRARLLDKGIIAISNVEIRLPDSPAGRRNGFTNNTSMIAKMM